MALDSTLKAEMALPDVDAPEPVVSVVVPAMNESLNVVEFVSWVKEGLASLPVQGEIIIVDSSDDETPELARAAGARVLRVPRRGLGRAYIDAIPHIRGELVIMGDADCTYDFRNLRPFYDAYVAGSNYVMGSRYKGSIEKGSMPPHHRYLGTPITTWMLNRIFRSKFSDIHCGMRALTTDLLRDMNLQSQSWDYASEMVIKSIQMGARISEVPVTFLKDRNGRLSHHRREGWLSPFKAAWINMRAMFTHGADAFLVRPGFLLALVGLALVFGVSMGPLEIAGLTFSLHWQILGSVLTILGTGSVLLGHNVRPVFDYSGRHRDFSSRLYRYNRSLFVCVVGVLVGFFCGVPLISAYVQQGLALASEDAWRGHLAVLGVTLGAMSFQYFVHTLVFHAISTRLNEIST